MHVLYLSLRGNIHVHSQSDAFPFQRIALSSTIKRSHIPLEANFLKQGFAIFFQADITRDEMSLPHLVFATNDLLH